MIVFNDLGVCAFYFVLISVIIFWGGGGGGVFFSKVLQFIDARFSCFLTEKRPL